MERPHLRNSQMTPFLLPQHLQGPSRSVHVIPWDDLEHVFRQLHVPIFELVVAVSIVEVQRISEVHPTTVTYVQNPCSGGAAKIIFRATVLERLVRDSPRRVMNQVDEFFKLISLLRQQRAWSLVSSRDVDVGRHDGGVLVGLKPHAGAPTSCVLFPIQVG